MKFAFWKRNGSQKSDPALKSPAEPISATQAEVLDKTAPDQIDYAALVSGIIENVTSKPSDFQNYGGYFAHRSKDYWIYKKLGTTRYEIKEELPRAEPDIIIPEEYTERLDAAFSKRAEAINLELAQKAMRRKIAMVTRILK